MLRNILGVAAASLGLNSLIGMSDAQFRAPVRIGPGMRSHLKGRSIHLVGTITTANSGGQNANRHGVPGKHDRYRAAGIKQSKYAGKGPSVPGGLRRLMSRNIQKEAA